MLMKVFYEVNNELYSALLASSQQLQLISIGKTSNVHMVDAPERPERPVTPRVIVTEYGEMREFADRDLCDIRH